MIYAGKWREESTEKEFTESPFMDGASTIRVSFRVECKDVVFFSYLHCMLVSDNGNLCSLDKGCRSLRGNILICQQ